MFTSRTLKRAAALVPAALLAVALFLPTGALAHERRTVVGGKYDFVVGWDVEPAFQGLKNGASVRISQAGTDPAVPVTGAEKTLKVQIRAGEQMKEFPLRAVFGQQGYYLADLIPSRVGDYQWTFVGTLDGDPVNETFDTADGKFNAVESAATITFPPVAGADTGATTSSPGMTDHSDMGQDTP
jgi:hypothetical protein